MSKCRVRLSACIVRLNRIASGKTYSSFKSEVTIIHVDVKNVDHRNKKKFKTRFYEINEKR